MSCYIQLSLESNNASTEMGVDAMVYPEIDALVTE